MIKNLIFDLDNTLCDCSVFYLEKQDALAQFQADRTGLPKEFCFNLQRKIDVEFTSLPEGFNRTRFPRSFAAASAVIDVMLGNIIDEVAAEHSFLLGDSVFDAPYPLYNGVFETLSKYKAAGYNLILFSKGDFDVQLRKVEINNLFEIFDQEKIYIVGHKNPEDLQRIMDDHQLTSEETLVIGDSLRDEIGCASKLNIPSAWVYGDSLHNSWEYENKMCPFTYEIKNVTDLPDIVSVESLLQRV